MGGEKDYTVPLLIGGKEKITSDTFPVVSPATGETVHQCSNATVADAEEAVEAAAAALNGWKRKTPAERRGILLKAAEILAKRKEELASYMETETAASKDWANFNLDNTHDMLVDVAGRISDAVTGAIPPTRDINVSAMVVKEPYGVVLAMAPWNAPYILGMRSVLFPLAVGNTVVFKGSELSPRTMWGICSVLAEAGVPEGALSLVFCSRETAPAVTETLIAHKHMKKINFTGSTSVGRIIGRLSGEHLKPLLLELGGKAPAIVWEDADLDNAAAQCALGAYLASGQICMSTERIIVHEAVAEQFRGKFAACVNKFFPSSADAPVLVQAQGVARNHELLKDALSKGAEVVVGDAEAKEANAHSMRPVAIRGVTPDMDIYMTESFGPTVSLIEVNSEEEALRIANDTEYGLTSAVFTNDLRRALRLAHGIETGAVHINSMSVHDESGLPHGGAKASGFGRFNAADGLGEWVRTKNITYRI
ncbi:hypothetical protein MCOR25_004038 [Pyricularia grisea]|uniref:Aldehyde dehydrogenase domain-containing protein n=1 Tax=Pyricularia grisea TaxID=148305 RepID=A0A6P8AVJ6_PYRGI|nr:uncharacterized protein PgNI_08665 [Pyricularia grisea]KAI6371104.1 hypothetical protein MCOR25_004038 [Pyricularia grisea]TLD06189.1 hypothetical protein PgNI_08665 [Pyricularia grisea]